MKICEMQLCTGCLACATACKSGSIELGCDGIGHVMPKVNTKSCVGCGECLKACPARCAPVFNSPVRVCAGFSTDREDRRTSASGGAASVFARRILSEGGAAFGAVVGDDFRLRHTLLESAEDVRKAKGSKYLQSDTSDSFSLAAEQLEKGRTVIYFGTPCQIAGLKNALGKSYDSLITVDLICHGVAPQKLFMEHVKALLGKDRLDRHTYAFKNAEGAYLEIFDPDGIMVYGGTFYKDSYYLGFDKNLFLRESCYVCPYARSARVGDLSLGDFHGIGGPVEFGYDVKGGVSLILVNTQKGESLVKRCGGELILEDKTLEEAKMRNPQLTLPSVRHKKNKKFKALYGRLGFHRSAAACLKGDTLKYMLLNALQKAPVVSRAIAALYDVRRWLKTKRVAGRRSA